MTIVWTLFFFETPLALEPIKNRMFRVPIWKSDWIGFNQSEKTHSLILCVKNGITFAILSMDWFVYLHVSCIISLKLSKWGKYTLHGYICMSVYHILLYQPGIHKTHHFWRVLQKFQLPHKMKSFGMKKSWVKKKGIAWFTLPKTNILLMEEILHQVKTDHVRYNTAMSLQAVLQWSTKLLYRAMHTPCTD